jgi:hypothetical protein
MMSVWLCSTVLVLPLARGDFDRLPATSLVADLDALKSNLERLHPGLHRYTSVEDLDAAFGRARVAVERGMTAPEFYGVVCEVLAAIRCGHTRARMPESMRHRVLEEKRLLPFVVRVLQGKVYVTGVVADARGLLPLGSEIRAIEGQSIDAIVSHLLAMLSGDGMIETGRRHELELSFATHYALFTPGKPDSFELQVVPPGAGAGEKRTLTVPGSSAADVQALAPAPDVPLFSMHVDRDVGVGLIDIRTFGRDADLDYEKFLAQSFERLESEEVSSLIIDLRDNGGGADQYGALLVSYLTDKPFRYFDRIEVTEGYSGPGGIVRGSDGRRLVTSHPGLLEQQPAEHSFLGRVCLLVDGGTFSTAADVATVVHYLKLARIVGEESGGGYDGNTSGSSQQLVLPSSRIEVSIPLWMYTTANPGHHLSGRGVPPDMVVTPTIQQVLAHDDVGMRRARELLAGK